MTLILIISAALTWIGCTGAATRSLIMQRADAVTHACVTGLTAPGTRASCLICRPIHGVRSTPGKDTP
jgi:hypothetical protein